jgi:glycosyltransferase involved in cell wall biosynthesis
MHIQIVDPSAYTPPYDHALCAALVEQGAEIELITSHFPYGERPPPEGYRVRELFYRRAFGPPGSQLRSLTKLAGHLPAMARLRALAREADVVHFQWLPVQWLDAHLLPRRPLVLTAHDLLPREPRPGQTRAQRRLYDAVDAIVVHSEYGRSALSALGVDSRKLHVIHHGAFQHLVSESGELPPELPQTDAPVVLFFGLLRPYKGLDVLLEAWREVDRGELWIVGRPRMPFDARQHRADAGRLHVVPRFVSEAELAALFTRAAVVVLPYLKTERIDQSGVLATALAFGKAIVVSDVGGFPEVAAAGAARLVPAEDALALAGALDELLADRSAREQLEAGARAAAEGPYSWREAARRTLELYSTLRALSPPQSERR